MQSREQIMMIIDYGDTAGSIWHSRMHIIEQRSMQELRRLHQLAWRANGNRRMVQSLLVIPTPHAGTNH